MKMIKDEDGQVGIIGAILLIGVALMLLSVFVTYYVPDIVRRSEIAHLQETSESFLKIRDGVASQIQNKNVGSIYPVSLSIGKGGGSLLGIGNIAGSLSINPSTSFYINSTTYSIRANGSLVYEPAFSVLIHPQVSTYEWGGVVFRQGGRSIVKSGPIIDIRENVSSVIVNMSVVSLSSMEMTSISGTITTSVNLYMDYIMPIKFYLSGQEEIGDIILDFNTPNAKAWRDYFESLFEDIGNEFYVFDPNLNTENRMVLRIKNVELNNSNFNFAIVRVSMGVTGG
jgi:hypothetical protein